VFLASNFLVPNATFVVELVAFLVVLGLLAKYVLPPVNKAMTDRQAVIRQSLADAETAKRKADEAETEYRETLDRAKAEARAIVDEANKAAEALRNTRKEQAEQEYQRIVGRAETDIEASRRRAAEDVRREVSSLVLAVVERVVGAGLDTGGHQDLIDRTVGEVEAQASSAPEVNA
jgi:F-type H+-transporting ATPase subunit b